ncbi:MAG: penicillin acylase family protein [bacterium]|nr:penicillin acylase family protein [bacterium]
MSKRITQADLHTALPDVTSTLSVSGLQQTVEIIRDRWGVPHIRAATEHDAFFAQGLVTAQDRMWHMDYDRQRALGRWSEFAGSDGLVEDRLMRRLQLEQAAKADYRVCSHPARAMLDAYSAGVNAFLATTRTLPIEYTILDTTPEAWEAWHCLAVYKVRNMLMGVYEMKLWRAQLALGIGPDKAAALFRGYPQGGLVAMPPGETYQGPPLDGLEALSAAAEQLNWLGEVDGGSNAWVVSGAYTASGLPLLAGDSHRGLDTPNVYYQTHIVCPQFQVSGYAVPGLPGAPHFSHTEYVGWGMTHGYGDYQDLYIEQFRSHHGQLQYAFKDNWLPADVADQTLHVRNGTAESLRVVTTRHGPIIAGHPDTGWGLAFCHPGTQSGTPWPDSVYQLLLARSADEAEAALREWTEPVNNFVYADVHGAFGYRYRGRIPLRSMANAWCPVPGWTGEHEWQGQIPFEELPHIRNPQAGFAVTCNNAVTTHDYPYYINTYFGSDFRARRVTECIRTLTPGTATVDDMAAIHADRQSIPAQALVNLLRQCQLTDPLLVAARDILLQWNCQMDRASVAATIYATARTYLYTDIIETSLQGCADQALASVYGTGRGAPAHANQIYAQAVTAMGNGDTSLLSPGQTWSGMVTSALQRAVAELRQRLGDEMSDWTWDQVHYTRPRHPLSRVFPELAALLDPPSVPAGGDGDTPQQGGYSITDRFVLTSMSVNRYIHDPADWRRSRWIVPLGASGHPGSSHYADQAERWSDVQTIPQLWEWDDVTAAAETQQQLKPGV